MKNIATSRVANVDPFELSFTVFSETRMLSALGNDLRELYDDVTDTSQPDHLTRLAALIDARRDVSGVVIQLPAAVAQ
jgi:hypothetical protein